MKARNGVDAIKFSDADPVARFHAPPPDMVLGTDLFLDLISGPTRFKVHVVRPLSNMGTIPTIRLSTLCIKHYIELISGT